MVEPQSLACTLERPEKNVVINAHCTEYPSIENCQVIKNSWLCKLILFCFSMRSEWRTQHFVYYYYISISQFYKFHVI